jgi:hypothetical protein
LEADTPETGLFIYFLQENYNYKQNPCGLTKLFLHFLPDVKCRAAIYAPPALGLVFHPNLSSRDCATASVTIEGERVYFSSVYLDIHLAVAEPVWILTMQKESSTRRHFMAGIDSNCHSNVRGSSDTNVRGLLLEVLFEQGLCVLNKGSDPIFQSSLATTCIDITVASPALASLVSDWAVQTEKHLSDHYLITANLKVKPDSMPIRFGRHRKKADWPEFLKVVTNALHKYEDGC